MKEKPILFSGPMVQEILDGRKTQTRRVIKPQPQSGRFGDWSYFKSARSLYAAKMWMGESAMRKFLPRDYSPYGQPGDSEWKHGHPPADGWYYVRGFSEDQPVWLRRYNDGLLWGYDEHDDPEAIEVEGLEAGTIEWKRPGDTLWVRETWATIPLYDIMEPSRLVPSGTDLFYRADNSQTRYNKTDPGRWRPSIFMPRWASRITLRVKSIRVERVQEISAVDAMCEGIALAHNPINKLTIEALGNRSSTGLAAIEDFIALWDSINAKLGFGWHVNPFVWVVEFEKVEVGE